MTSIVTHDAHVRPAAFCEVCGVVAVELDSTLAAEAAAEHNAKHNPVHVCYWDEHHGLVGTEHCRACIAERQLRRS